MQLIDADKLNFEKLQDTNGKAIPANEYIAFLKGAIAAEELIKNAPTIDAENLKKMTELKPCEMCLNARVDDELTDKNDFSSIGIGKSTVGVRLSLNAGYGKPLRFEITKWNEKTQRNELIATYYPKFCPNCGRPIIEYGDVEQK